MATINKPAPKKAAPKKAMPATGGVYTNGPSKTDEARWRAEDDLRTMQRMAELKRDPSRVRAAEKLIQEQMSAIKAVKGK
jgi:cell division protein FtsN